MVFFEVKFSEIDRFLYETKCEESNETLIRTLADINNKRHLIERLVPELERLGKHGFAKSPDKQGLDEYSEVPVEKGPLYSADPLGKRTGNGVAADLISVLMKAGAEALAYVSKDQALCRVPLTPSGLNEKLEILKGAVMIAYPMGLPEYDPVQEMLDGREVLEGSAASQDFYDPETCTLWWAGQEFIRSGKASDRIGKNEKTTIICKLQKKGSGPPMRQPGVTEEERKQMMSLYYKKQEEMKKLADDDDDTYMGSAWANPRNLKSDLHGLGGNIRFR